MIIKTTHEEMRRMALESIPRKSIVLEIGCSSGNFAEIIRRTEHGYIGVDIQTGKINEAQKKLPDMTFINCDITKNLKLLKKANVIVSFQCFEHIKKDLKLLKAIQPNTRLLISVPNRKYKGHVRWFEADGWEKRFSPFIDIHDVITIQHPTKKNNRSFLFKGVKGRNES